MTLGRKKQPNYHVVTHLKVHTLKIKEILCLCALYQEETTIYKQPTCCHSSTEVLQKAQWGVSLAALIDDHRSHRK